MVDLFKLWVIYWNCIWISSISFDLKYIKTHFLEYFSNRACITALLQYSECVEFVVEAPLSLDVSASSWQEHSFTTAVSGNRTKSKYHAKTSRVSNTFARRIQMNDTFRKLNPWWMTFSHHPRCLIKCKGFYLTLNVEKNGEVCE